MPRSRKSPDRAAAYFRDAGDRRQADQVAGAAMLLEIAQIEGAMLAIGIGEVEAALAPEQLDDARRRGNSSKIHRLAPGSVRFPDPVGEHHRSSAPPSLMLLDYWRSLEDKREPRPCM
ncbi:MAG: hypothetical protein R3D25_13380 [Geminicoccaceae bacterium]